MPVAQSRSALAWGIAAAVAYAAVAAGILLAHHGNPQWFVNFGSDSVVTPVARAVFGAHLLAPYHTGFDGQAYWLLARDPLLRDAAGLRAHLDFAVYRSRRIGYPLVAAPWRLLGDTGLLWGLVTTNVAVAGIGTWTAARIGALQRAAAWAPLAFALNPAVILSLDLDVADGMALAATLAAVLLTVRRRYALAAAAGCVAVLTRETSLLALLGVAAFAPDVARRGRVALAACPAATIGLWALYVRARLGSQSPSDFAAPLLGFADAARGPWSHGYGGDGLIGCALLGVAIATLMRLRRPRTLLSCAAVPFSVLALFLSVNVWRLGLGSLRAMAPLVTFFFLDLAAAPHRSAAPLENSAA